MSECPHCGLEVRWIGKRLLGPLCRPVSTSGLGLHLFSIVHRWRFGWGMCRRRPIFVIARIQGASPGLLFFNVHWLVGWVRGYSIVWGLRRGKLYAFANSLLGATIWDGGKRERSDLNGPLAVILLSAIKQSHYKCWRLRKEETYSLGRWLWCWQSWQHKYGFEVTCTEMQTRMKSQVLLGLLYVRSPIAWVECFLTLNCSSFCTAVI